MKQNKTFGAVETESVTSRDTPVANVKWFGAVGDGQTDDRPAIKAALDHIESLGGGTVYLPRGDYYIGNVEGESAIPLHFSDVTLKGAGKGETRLLSHFGRDADVYDGSTASALISAYGSSSGNISNVHIRDFSIYIVENWPGTAIAGTYVDHSSIHNVHIDNTSMLQDGATSGHTIWFGLPGTEKRNSFLSITNCDVVSESNNNPCYEMSGTDNGLIANCLADGIGAEAGVKIEASSRITVVGSVLDIAPATGIQFGIDVNQYDTNPMPTEVSIVNNIINTPGMGIRLNNGTNHVVSGNQVTSDGNGMFLAAAENCAVSGNVFDLNGEPSAGARLRGSGPIALVGNSFKNGKYGVNTPAGDQTADAVIVGNQIENCTYGMQLVSPVSAGVLAGFNKITGATSEDIDINENNNGDPVANLTLVGNHSDGSGDGLALPATATAFLVAANRMPISYTGEISPTEQLYGNSPRFYHLDTTATFAGGGTQQFTVSGATPGSEVDVSAVPNADPGNDLGFSVDKQWYDTAAAALKVQVSETEAAGGGDARITAKIVG